ncbi:MAG: hypothetical protein ACRDN0_25870 [Trebonia sp.]
MKRWGMDGPGPVVVTAALDGQAALLLLEHAPWWANFPMAALLVVPGVLRAVFPQDSGDRIAWWREYWTLRQRERAPGTRRHER